MFFSLAVLAVLAVFPASTLTFFSFATLLFTIPSCPAAAACFCFILAFASPSLTLFSIGVGGWVGGASGWVGFGDLLFALDLGSFSSAFSSAFLNAFFSC